MLVWHLDIEIIALNYTVQINSMTIDSLIFPD